MYDHIDIIKAEGVAEGFFCFWASTPINEENGECVAMQRGLNNSKERKAFISGFMMVADEEWRNQHEYNFIMDGDSYLEQVFGVNRTIGVQDMEAFSAK